jgi:predicted DsbA family dithiol-disulfide isomerase
MPQLAIPVHYDFASTICFVAHRVLETMRADLDAMEVTLDWRPIDLSSITGWRRGAIVDGPRRDNALRVASELGVAVRMPGIWLDSRRAHVVAIALSGNTDAAWRERVWSAVFEEGRDIGAPGEVERLAADLGIDLDGLVDLQDFSRLDALTEAAREAEVIGVPTFHLGFPLGGIQEPATMRLLFQRWADKQRRARG